IGASLELGCWSLLLFEALRFSLCAFFTRSHQLSCPANRKTSMRHLISSVLAFLSFTVAVHAQEISPVKLDALACEHLNNPLGIGAQTPRLSWKLRSNRAGEVQTAYEIRAARSHDALSARPDLWDSGKINSDQSVLVPWNGKPLGSRAQVFW